MTKKIVFKTKSGDIVKTPEEALADNDRLRHATSIELAYTDDKLASILSLYGDPVIVIAMREWNFLLERNALPPAARDRLRNAPKNRRLSVLRHMLMGTGIDRIPLDPELWQAIEFNTSFFCNLFETTVKKEFLHE